MMQGGGSLRSVSVFCPRLLNTIMTCFVRDLRRSENASNFREASKFWDDT